MKLFQALKEKKRLLGDISQIKRRISDSNSIIEGNTRDYDVRDLVTQLSIKINELLELKSKIQKANENLYPMIFLMAEEKGLIQFYSSLSTMNGKYIERGGYGSPATEAMHTCEITKKEVDQIIADKTAKIRDLQDKIDIYNHTTDV